MTGLASNIDRRKLPSNWEISEASDSKVHIESSVGRVTVEEENKRYEVNGYAAKSTQIGKNANLISVSDMGFETEHMHLASEAAYDYANKIECGDYILDTA